MASSPYEFEDGTRIHPRGLRRAESSGNGNEDEAAWTRAVLANAAHEDASAVGVTIRVRNQAVRLRVRASVVRQAERDRYAALGDPAADRVCAALAFTPSTAVRRDADTVRARVPHRLLHQPYIVADRESGVAQRLEMARSLASTLHIAEHNKVRRFERFVARVEKREARAVCGAAAAGKRRKPAAAARPACADRTACASASACASATTGPLLADSAAATLPALGFDLSWPAAGPPSLLGLHSLSPLPAPALLANPGLPPLLPSPALLSCLQLAAATAAAAAAAAAVAAEPHAPAKENDAPLRAASAVRAASASAA